MKKFIFFARVCTWLLLPMTTVLKAQNIDPYPNYVVIGAFASEKNAAFWTREANHNRFKARFEVNPNRNLFYVYVLTTEDRAVAFEQALKLRKETKYFDTWVYSGTLGKNALISAGHESLDFNPVTQQQITAVPADQNSKILNRNGTAGTHENYPLGNRHELVSSKERETSALVTKSSERKSSKDATVSAVITDTNGQHLTSDPLNPRSSELSDRPHVVGADQVDQNLSHASEFAGPKKPTSQVLDATIADRPVQKATPKPENATPLSSADIVGKNFYFQLFRASNNDLVEGDVDAIDVEKSRRMATYKSNAPVKVVMPMGKSKQVSFVSDVFGYRKLQKDFDPASPSEEFYLDQQENLVIPFQLVRLQKGDIAIMYNVFFFKDAGVMRPESRYEVNNLLELLNENPSYKIIIHGHTNGNSNGKILSLGYESENFYSLNGAKEGFGSAKKLSEERAEVMKKYLVSKGVDADRMQIKAWGGKKPIHDKHAVRANENVRVEIEILSD